MRDPDFAALHPGYACGEGLGGGALRCVHGFLRNQQGSASVNNGCPFEVRASAAREGGSAKFHGVLFLLVIRLLSACFCFARRLFVLRRTDSRGAVFRRYYKGISASPPSSNYSAYFMPINLLQECLNIPSWSAMSQVRRLPLEQPPGHFFARKTTHAAGSVHAWTSARTAADRRSAARP